MHRRLAPFDLGPVHFIGIGGIGMSGIAEIMLRRGYIVQGSDARESANTERLRTLGARVFIGHDPDNVENVSAVVYSSAIRPDNVEMAAARAARIPLVRRAEMLAELMRLLFSVAVSGTHGKTTTTSLVAALLDAGGLDPTVVNGGIINAYGANAKVGGGEWIVVEADESDGTFLKLRSTVAVVTNIDPEHLDHHGDFETLTTAFRDFVQNIPFYGFAVLCIDHPVVQELAANIDNRRLVTYGINPQAEIRAAECRHGSRRRDIRCSDNRTGRDAVDACRLLHASGGVAQRAQRPGGDRRRAGARGGRRRSAQRAGGVRGGPSAFHHDRSGWRREGDRRLRASPRGDRQRACRCAVDDERPGDRRGSAAPLFEVARPVCGILPLFQRCGRGPRWTRLSRWRGAD